MKDGGRTAWLAARFPYLLALVVLLAFAAVSVFDSIRTVTDWPYGAPVRSDGTYASVMEPLIPHGAAIRPMLALREDPGVEDLERLVLPQNPDLLRDRIEYGERMVSPVALTLLEDLLADKIVQQCYDPVLDEDAFRAVKDSDNLVMRGDDTYLATDGATALRLYTDPSRTAWIVVPDGERP